ncbi:LOW QUALITY PROTEIN: hypothetical protein M514_10250 [Trichuris suis]|uniref:Peptidase aspartic putative domain-containing protein n=1 Tax=Trichuris suis TaxID=68888 RepID=A0A085N9R7_9BILA|nr:LOW QUALITY PROTEIN: hypothetical protein M514_10250 [Trichuris suis]
MPSSRSSRASRRNTQSGVSVSSDVAEEDLGHYSPPRSPVDVSVPASADECVTNPGLDAVASRLTSQISTLLSSFCDRLMDRLATLQVNAAQDTMAVLSTPSGDLQTVAAHTVKTSSPLSSVSLHDGVFQSEKGEPKPKQSMPSQNDEAEEHERSVKQTGSRVTADGWISGLASPQATLLPATPSWLREIAPAVNIEPFDGDPLQWDMFISSFKSLVHNIVGSDAQRLAILRQLLVPSLGSALACSLSSPETYALALNDLRRLYGNTSAVITACLRKLSKIEPMKPRSDADAERFYLELHGILNILRARDRLVEVKSAITLQAVVSKLTGHLRLGPEAVRHSSTRGTLEDLDLWLEHMVLTNRTVEPVDLPNRTRSPQETVSRSNRHRLNVGTVTDNSVECVLCHDGHLLSVCPEFVNSTPNRGAEIAKNFRRCFACLDGAHNARRCPKRTRYDVTHCNQRHHRLLHGSQRVYPPSLAVDVQVVAEHSTVQTANIGANTVDHVSICLSVVPVYLAAGSRSISTVAFLDPDSQGTLISNEMASRLGLARKPSNVHLSTFHGRDPLLSASSVDFAIRGRNGQQQFDIRGALVEPSINLSCRTVNWNRERDKWPHLKDLPLTDVNYGKVSVLIGADNFEVMQQLALRKPSRKGEPFGMLTPLGWTVVGRLSQPFRHRRPSTERMINELLSEFEIYERFWNTESFGTQPVQRCRDIELSKIAWPSSLEFVQGRYAVGLLWKSDDVTLPNNCSMAKSRFESLRKRLVNDPVLYDLYREAMSCLSRSGIIRLVMPYEADSPVGRVCPYEADSPVGRVWYLPHHPVRHPSKPGKVRIVFDASAKFDGLSLNDHLEKGSDLRLFPTWRICFIRSGFLCATDLFCVFDGPTGPTLRRKRMSLPARYLD